MVPPPRRAGVKSSQFVGASSPLQAHKHQSKLAPPNLPTGIKQASLTNAKLNSKGSRNGAFTTWNCSIPPSIASHPLSCQISHRPSLQHRHQLVTSPPLVAGISSPVDSPPPFEFTVEEVERTVTSCWCQS